MEESSSTTSRKRTKKNLVGGFRNYCCVPGCKSAFYGKFMRRSKKEMTCVEACCSKGGADSFDVKDEDLTTILGRGKSRVKAGRVPSIFREQPVKQKATRPPPKNRPASFVESETESDQVLSSSSPSSQKESSESYVEEASETERLIEEIKQPRTKN